LEANNRILAGELSASGGQSHLVEAVIEARQIDSQRPFDALRSGVAKKVGLFYSGSFEECEIWKTIDDSDEENRSPTSFHASGNHRPRKRYQKTDGAMAHSDPAFVGDPAIPANVPA
jgi:hypothetical protein